MKNISLKTASIWNSREEFFDRLRAPLKGAAFILFLVLLLATIFGDGFNGRWLECLVGAVALAIIIKK